MWKLIGVLILFMLVILGITWISEGNDFFLYKVFYPARIQVQTDAYKNSQAYQGGTIQTLNEYMMQYKTAPDQAHKDALKSLILSTAADYGDKRLSEEPTLFAFVQSLRNSSSDLR